MSQLVRAKITALGAYVPPRLLTNDDLEKLVETSNDWIVERTGIRERHIVDKGVATSDLAAEAARRALAQRGWSPLSWTRFWWPRSRPTCFSPRPPAWCSTSWAPKGLGIRSFGRLLRIRLRAADRSAIHRHRRPQEGDGHWGGRDVLDH